MITEKKCSKCGEVKAVDEFRKHRNSCKVCEKEYYIKYVEKNKNELKEKAKIYVEKNKEHYKEYKKEWNESNKDKILNYNKQYYKDNKDRENKKSKEWKIKNKDRYIKHNIKYCKNWRYEKVIKINGERFNINTAPEQLKSIIQELIENRKLKNELKKIKENLR